MLRGDEDEPTRAVDVQRCRGLLADASRDCWTGEFQTQVEGKDDPRPAVAAIERAVRREGGFVLASCHGVMHTVGRTYALERQATLADLKDYLPRSNDPGCSAGFAHGLVTGAAPSIDTRRPREAAEICADAGARYRRYSCVHGLGHAFMRIHGDRLEPALGLCRALGPRAAPDCAQGAYHDYWFAILGADDAMLREEPVTDPRRLCGAQPERFVRPCWYRVFLENRFAGFRLETPRDLEDLCEGLDGVQRAGCITAAALIGPPDPAAQLRICARLEDAADSASCVRGTKVQNLRGASTREHVELIDGCGLFPAQARAACYRWLGKALAVITDGRFEKSGCPEITESDARRQCHEGTRAMDGPLVTFS